LLHSVGFRPEWPIGERQMRAGIVMALIGVALSGCASGTIAAGEDANVSSSLQYDGVACKQLIGERDALAARYGLSRDAKPVFTSSPTGLGTVIPDMRSGSRREADQAAGRVDAMNRSLVRRKCVAAPKG
jgi:hypothetical protein